MKKFLRSIMLYLAEAIVCLLLVSIFFGVFLLIINSQFPSGDVLGSIFNFNTIISGGNKDLKQRNLKLFRNFDEVNFGEQGNFAAFLSRRNNSVKSKRAADIAWQSAAEGMALYDHDAIQTYNRSSARIKFDPASYIDMRENSLIIIKKLEKDFINNERRSFIVVADGEFRGRFLSSRENPVYLELETPNALARIRTSASGPSEVDFKVMINPDQTSSFIVYEGKAEIEAQGVKVELGANQMTSVGIDGKPETPHSLPDPVKLHAPDDDRTFVYRKLPPKITFSWKELPDTVGYFFQLASDPSFFEPLFEEEIYQSRFAIGSLKNGVYYWRVASMGGKDADIFSRTRSVVVEEDTVAPQLTVEFPEDIVHRNSVAINGRAEPGSSIYIDNRQVSVDAKGNFVYDLKLNQGINVIIVEAADLAGNTTYRTKLINGKF